MTATQYLVLAARFSLCAVSPLRSAIVRIYFFL